VGFANLGPSLPAPPLLQDDRLRRDEFPPRQANTGLVGDPEFAPRSFFGLGIGFGWPLGGPSVAQGPRERRARVEGKKYLCLQQKVKKAGRGKVGFASSDSSFAAREAALSG